MVIIDTCVWIEFFKKAESEEKKNAATLIKEGQAMIAGIVLSEIIQGIKIKEKINKLVDAMLALPIIETKLSDWIKCGIIGNQLRSKGITIPLTDILLAAIAMENNFEIYTSDKHFRQIDGLMLYNPID